MTLQTNSGLANHKVDIGSTVQVQLDTTALGLATTIVGSGNIDSNVIPTNGFKSFAISVTSTQSGTLTIKRYLDLAGTIAHGTDITASLISNTLAVATSTDGIPFQSIKINVSNGSGSSATLSTVLLLLQSQ